MNSANSFQRTAVFISGTGSCLQALLETSEYQNICLVIANKKNISGLLKAKRFGTDTICMDFKFNFSELHKILKQKKIEKIFLAGFMKIIPSDFIENWSGKIFNIHPSLLPKHKGLRGFEKSFEAMDDMGATIHHVTAEMDSGKIIFQKKSETWNPDLSQNKAQISVHMAEQHILREFSQKRIF